MITEIKISLAFIGSAIKAVWRVIPAIINYIYRPKAVVEIKNQHIVIRDSSNTESHINYPCILLSFQKDVRIDVRSIKLNNETLMCILSSDPNFLNQKDGSKNQVIITNNRIMPFISENWLQLNQQACYIDIKKFDQEVLPLFVNQEKSHFLFQYKKEPRVFMARKKLVISLSIDSHTYEYALPLLDVCKLVINHLAFK